MPEKIPSISHAPSDTAAVADIVLPLAVPGAYTYTVPEELADRITVGSRVVVPLGQRKTYTGIVVRYPGTPPATDVVLKAVADIVGDRPLLFPVQLDLWRWLADYYICTPGEVMKAALPSGLKLESETAVRAVAGAEPQPGMTPREADVLAALPQEKSITINDLMRRLAGRTGVMKALHRLVACGVAVVSENLKQGFQPRTERHVRLAARYANATALHFLLDSLRRSPRRTAVVTALLDEEGQPLEGMARAVLLRRLPGSEGALTSLRHDGIIDVYDVVTDRLRPIGERGATPDPIPTLSSAQQTALDAVKAVFAKKNVCLLHGVTSSGKTEVYIRLIADELAAGRQVLYLLPEIALTTQITTRLGRIFGDRMGVYHSKFPDAERVELWQRQLTDRAFPLILGVRSSLFLPFTNLGLIIVDEEHETSYKQQDPAPRYNARDAAIMLGRLTGARVLLGTATPAVETYHNATTGKYGLVRLTERYGGVQLPRTVVEDIKELRRKKLMKTPFSPRLISETRRILAEGGQVIFFHNRRGYAPILECHTCGWTPHCKACDVPLTYHRQMNRLVCHYCGASYAVPTVCPNCAQADLRDIGAGTEKIETAVEEIFPEARIGRMDLDTTRSRTAYERLIGDFQNGKTNLLIGTQMVTKGLDFGGVRLVGIINADQMLNRPDFRAHERAFQMMAQVAGRAGRRDEQGLVILQTRQPQLPVIAQVVGNDYEGLYASQITERKLYVFPPLVRLIYICVRHRDEAVADHAAMALAEILRPSFGEYLLGPDRPTVGRVQYLHLRRLMLKVRPELSPQGVRNCLLAATATLQSMPSYKGAGIYFDVDPL